MKAWNGRECGTCITFAPKPADDDPTLEPLRAHMRLQIARTEWRRQFDRFAPRPIDRLIAEHATPEALAAFREEMTPEDRLNVSAFRARQRKRRQREGATNG